MMEAAATAAPILRPSIPHRNDAHGATDNTKLSQMTRQRILSPRCDRTHTNYRDVIELNTAVSMDDDDGITGNRRIF